MKSMKRLINRSYRVIQKAFYKEEQGEEEVNSTSTAQDSEKTFSAIRDLEKFPQFNRSEIK